MPRLHVIVTSWADKCRNSVDPDETWERVRWLVRDTVVALLGAKKLELCALDFYANRLLYCAETGMIIIDIPDSAGKSTLLLRKTTIVWPKSLAVCTAL